jgi:hypothetical protein
MRKPWLQVVGFTVEHGSPSRSYVRYELENFFADLADRFSASA